ncbi:unnamed protein product [Heterosigma akashiwo]
MANGLDIGAKMAEAKGRNAALLSAARKNLDLTVLSPTGIGLTQGGKNELATQARFSRVKAGVLLALVVQNTLLVTLMRYTRSRRDRPLYSSGAAIVANEALKLVLSVGLLAWEHGGDPAATLAEIHAATVGGPRELAKMAVPAGLFTAQNFLGYLALSNLPPATYQLLSQGKILTTAAFSVALLGKGADAGAVGVPGPAAGRGGGRADLRRRRPTGGGGGGGGGPGQRGACSFYHMRCSWSRWGVLREAAEGLGAVGLGPQRAAGGPEPAPGAGPAAVPAGGRRRRRRRRRPATWRSPNDLPNWV